MWTIREEKKFIDALGTWQVSRSDIPYADRLRRYLETLDLRQDNPEWLAEAKRYAKQKLQAGDPKPAAPPPSPNASPKDPWDEPARKRFLAGLELEGWRYAGQDHLGADLYELGNTRLAVDDYGIWVYARDHNPGPWWRIAGLADSDIDRQRGQNFLQLPDGRQLDLLQGIIKDEDKTNST